jgi:hypothetical protein
VNPDICPRCGTAIGYAGQVANDGLRYHPRCVVPACEIIPGDVGYVPAPGHRLVPDPDATTRPVKCAHCASAIPFDDLVVVGTAYYHRDCASIPDPAQPPPVTGTQPSAMKTSSCHSCGGNIDAASLFVLNGAPYHRNCLYRDSNGTLHVREPGVHAASPKSPEFNLRVREAHEQALHEAISMAKHILSAAGAPPVATDALAANLATGAVDQYLVALQNQGFPLALGKGKVTIQEQRSVVDEVVSVTGNPSKLLQHPIKPPHPILTCESCRGDVTKEEVYALRNRTSAHSLLLLCADCALGLLLAVKPGDATSWENVPPTPPVPAESPAEEARPEE